MRKQLSGFKTITSNVVVGATKLMPPLYPSIADLEFIIKHATRNNLASVLTAIDSFAATNTMMNVGADKGAIIDAEIRQNKPRIVAEISAYTDYSTVRFPSVQRDVAQTAGIESHYCSLSSHRSSPRVFER